MARRSFTEVPYQYGDGKFGVTLSQTRGGVEEHIMPVAFWELDATSGLYMPPGTSTNPKKPRVTVDGEVQLSGSLPPIWGADVSERPAADSVAVGQQFIVANAALDAWVSNGAEWVVI